MASAGKKEAMDAYKEAEEIEYEEHQYQYAQHHGRQSIQVGVAVVEELKVKVHPAYTKEELEAYFGNIYKEPTCPNKNAGRIIQNMDNIELSHRDMHLESDGWCWTLMFKEPKAYARLGKYPKVGDVFEFAQKHNLDLVAELEWVEVRRWNIKRDWFTHVHVTTFQRGATKSNMSSFVSQHWGREVGGLLGNERTLAMAPTFINNTGTFDYERSDGRVVELARTTFYQAYDKYVAQYGIRKSNIFERYAQRNIWKEEGVPQFKLPSVHPTLEGRKNLYIAGGMRRWGNLAVGQHVRFPSTVATESIPFDENLELPRGRLFIADGMRKEYSPPSEEDHSRSAWSSWTMVESDPDYYNKLTNQKKAEAVYGSYLCDTHNSRGEAKAKSFIPTPGFKPRAYNCFPYKRSACGNLKLDDDVSEESGYESDVSYLPVRSKSEKKARKALYKEYRFGGVSYRVKQYGRKPRKNRSQSKAGVEKVEKTMTEKLPEMSGVRCVIDKEDPFTFEIYKNLGEEPVDYSRHVPQSVLDYRSHLVTSREAFSFATEPKYLYTNKEGKKIYKVRVNKYAALSVLPEQHPYPYAQLEDSCVQWIQIYVDDCRRHLDTCKQRADYLAGVKQKHACGLYYIMSPRSKVL
ncbi:4994_t:CDS:2 [Ambispora gerdemannii]|uniref:4994_t:CDS:1 n=1 Tax=Ambispora gerdemannii TaxID=144530 RepID=A0A9N8V1T2_9GLOM|nr:4994_t:CDS:2 [Ambispora gerdemannii]